MAGKMTKSIRTNKMQARKPRNLPHIAGRLFGQPLLIDERKLEQIMPVFESKLNGTAPEAELNGDDYREAGELFVDTANGIAVISIVGTLIRRSTWLDAWSGLMSYSDIAENLECALNDARVKGIILQIDSFGGEAPGCFELCDAIYNSRSIKPIWAVADVEAMSAAYALLCSASQCYCAPRGHVASIGVISVHCERSRQNEMIGLNYTVFRAGARKGDFNPYEQLPPEAAQKQLASMERTRTVFVETVSRNRPMVSVQSALDTEGQWYDPEEGLELGLIDGVATFEEVFRNFAASLAAPEPEPPEPEPQAPIEPDESDDAREIDPPIDEEGATGLSASLISEEIDMATQAGGGNGGGGIPPKPAATAPVTGPAAAPGTVVDLPVSESRETQIASMCKLSGFPAMAPDFIMGTLSVPEVRDRLTNLRAEKDGDIDISNINPGRSGGATTKGSGISPSLAGFIQQQPSAEAVASWGPHLKAAQATNPRFNRTQQ